MLSDRLNLGSSKEIFKAYYGTLMFNVPYHREEKNYLPGLREGTKNADIYAKYRERLENLETEVSTLLSLFAASLMYLDSKESAESLDANLLFIVGGAAAYTAADILESVFKELEAAEKRFKIRASTNSSKNIISALNDNSRNPNYSSLVLGDILLTSSYIF
jgi:hypothetical protein